MKMVVLGLLTMTQTQPVPPIVLRPWPPAVALPRPPAPPPAPPSQPRQAAPLRNLISLISPDDYPREAMDDNQQGAVGVSLMVGADGRVATCTIVESSGWPILDAATCQILQRRARFRPARDERGAALADRVSQRVRWEMNAIPFTPVTRVSRIPTGPAGTIVSCAGSDDCWASEMSLDEGWKTLVGRPVAASSQIVVERRFEPGERAVAMAVPKPTDGTKLLFAASVRIGVGDNGKVTHCTPLRAGIGNAEGLCSLVTPWLFRLARDKGETRTGVMSLALQTGGPSGD